MMLVLIYIHLILINFIIYVAANEKRIFLNARDNQRIIVSPDFPDNSYASTADKWYIETLPQYRIELFCTNIFLTRTLYCSSGIFAVNDGSREIKKICEETNNFKIKSLNNRMIIEFWLRYFAIGKFSCRVNALPVPRSYLDIKSEEIDSREHGTYLGQKSTTCPCGWSNKEKGRIVGGYETKRSEYPAMVTLIDRSTREIICGGTIITPYHVLTAAHCLIGRWSPMSIFVGAHDLSKARANATGKIDVRYFIQHRGFTQKTLENDIAIGVLGEKINFNKYVGPICLPIRKVSSDEVYVKALGWGQISSTRRISSKVLKAVNLRIVDTETCSKKYDALRSDTKSQFCSYARKKDTCQGDSGGPLLWLDPETNRYTQLGIVSYGKRCASEVPAVNTDVYYFMSWILSNVAKHRPLVGVCYKENDVMNRYTG